MSTPIASLPTPPRPLRLPPWTPWRRLASPPVFEVWVARWWAPLLALALPCVVPGLWLTFFVMPADARQGDAVRLLPVHVASAWMSMWLYALMAFWSAMALVWRGRVASALAQAMAPTGAMFCALALVSGALWGQPTWGTWWVWDARLASQLLLLFLYLGVIGLRAAFDDERRAARLSALLALVGAVNLPVIWFSVHWWNTLHQGATITPRGAALEWTQLAALVLMTLAAWAYAAAMTLLRARCILAEQRAAPPRPRPTVKGWR
ncbi:heme ABC transporter permease CcmC [Azohydromonas caseinilytica]|uniref:Heme exporter protein C n=1 Tax=Azohydromonas caseinilytica TaxID=2728836 RepID=A0A848FJL6_9BURK|nr:heme ABC transporter permease CcmC [Azohydromonas caseinilytica]NML18410.1 cytochrome c biogenesis protein CcsA [Azohydromonas caseinilytica]